MSPVAPKLTTRDSVRAIQLAVSFGLVAAITLAAAVTVCLIAVVIVG